MTRYVTDSDSALRNAQSGEAGSGQPGPGFSQENSAIGPDSAMGSALTDGDRWAGLAERLAGYWTPPAVVVDRPASLSELAAYASTGAWTSQRGFWRVAGIWWFRLVGLPVTVAAYYGAWIAQRPGRALVLAVLYALLAHTGPGRWLLPWPTWAP